jgi:vacuolar-type H+-ATPase subunit H
MVEVEKLTYERIHQLKAEQDKLVAEGKIERPQIIKGFSPEAQREFDKGITLEDVFDEIGRKYGFI